VVVGVAGVGLFFLQKQQGITQVQEIKQLKSTSQASLLVAAKELEGKGELLGAKDIYQKLIADFPNARETGDWQKKIEMINIKLLFSSVETEKSVLYEVVPGDTLSKIAREYKTTIDLIKKSNNLSDDMIVSGRRLKVWTAPFSVLVDKSQNALILKSDEEIIKTYVVATGRNNSTPTGNFSITNKLLNPTWFKTGTVVPPDSPENILGTRWLGFNIPAYGIHGTTNPESLGTQATDGCVRMSNSDVEELYIIVPVGSEVTVVD